jgi:hypothetical protein
LAVVAAAAAPRGKGAVMGYNNSDSNKPESHFTVHVVINEVTPMHYTGVGTQRVKVDRLVEEAVNITVRGDNESEAIERAINLLQTADGRP